LLAKRHGTNFDTVIDINPAKQGKYLAATGLRVMSPSEAFRNLNPNSTVYVMNSNYFEEIKENSGNKYRYVRVDA
jgi:hypothetical protein